MNLQLKKSISLFLLHYNHSFYSSELLTWLENHKEANVHRKEALSFLNFLLSKNVLHILSGTTSEIIDDPKQVIQIQKNLIPMAFNNVLISGKLKSKKRNQLTLHSFHVKMYENGFGIFEKNGTKLIDAWLFVPSMKFLVTILKDQLSFDISILPYAQMTFKTKTTEDRKLWISELEKVKNYVDIKEDPSLASASWFKRHFF